MLCQANHYKFIKFVHGLQVSKGNKVLVEHYTNGSILWRLNLWINGPNLSVEQFFPSTECYFHIFQALSGLFYDSESND